MVEPEVDGHDGRRGEAARPLEHGPKRRRVALEQVADGEPGHCGDHRLRAPRPAGRRNRLELRPVNPHDGRGAGTNLTSTAFDERSGRRGVHGIEGFGREQNGSQARVGAEHLGQDTRKDRGGRARRRLIERGKRQGLPQHFAQPRSLSVANQPVVDRPAWGCGNLATGALAIL